ncbi:MAG: hemolysin III family protein [Planctomycetes bacterium]|nr:hemolysin III family protein [Planctomycetota bacterium]MCH9726661.1 hemolysin III family protein [Planctomycetota bacterium]MCH9779569.1 hemolysin III family protein [Planctomycetota bacterium]MCH9790351.1 hemolysin III family protein [Planctomycetota bacterium]
MRVYSESAIAINSFDLYEIMTTDSKELLSPKRAEHRPVDERANFITHALGFFLSVVASIVLMTLVIQHHQTINIVACGIYCSSLTGLYAASTFSHMFYDLAWRRFFRTLDQVCIYLLIAGSYTPFAVVYLWNQWWPMLMVVMWVLAIFGVFLVLHMRNLTPTAMITYGILGWLPIISLKTLYDAAPLDIFAWIIAGGFFYSAGSVFLIFDQRVRYFHALWHTFVIAGSTCHYIALLMVML